MEDLKSAIDHHFDQLADLIQKFSDELRSGLRPARENFIGFFHAIHWKEPWLMCLMGVHAMLLITTVVSRKKTNFQMCLFLLAHGYPTSYVISMAGVYFAERLNYVLGKNWKNFAGQNYFDPSGLFLSVLWSGPLLVIAILILINTLFSLCYQIVRWKKAELRHRARLSHNKED